MLQHDQPQINEQEPSSSDSSNSIKDSKRTGHGKNKIMVLCIINLWRRGQKFVYLPETSECTDLSFWKLWESHYSHYSGFDKCPRKCSAITLPQNR